MTMKTKTVEYVIDFGKKQGTIYDSKTNTIDTLSCQRILELPEQLPSGSLVVSEYAHLGCPRHKTSLAQYYTEQELFTLYDEFKSNNITLKLFPQHSLPRASKYAGLVKSDDNDPKSIYIWLKYHPEMIPSLMNPPKRFEPDAKRLESYEWVHTSTFQLNRARTVEPKYEHPEDQNYQFLLKNAQEIYERLSPNARSVFNFKLYKVSRKGLFQKGDVNISDLKMAPVFSVIVQLQDYDGDLRLREKTGELPGWNFIKRYGIKMSPFHLKGGVARSNLYHYGMPNWGNAQMAKELGVKKSNIQKKCRSGYVDEQGKPRPLTRYTPEEDALFLKYRRIYCKSIKELFVICKDILARRVQPVIPASNRSSSSHPTGKLQTRRVQESILT